MLPRVLEPEVMDTAEEAAEYDAMDHGEVNRRFCDDLLAFEPAPRHVVDVGTGTARIPIELCTRVRDCRVVATDLARHMLAIARRNVAAAGLADRIEPMRIDAKKSALAPGAFDVVMSNSIVHHIPEPGGALADMAALVARGGVLFVRDLARPDDDAAVRKLVETYAAHETPAARDLFEASLRAALTLDEVASYVARLGAPPSSVSMTSDRHWTLAWRKPSSAARRESSEDRAEDPSGFHPNPEESSTSPPALSLAGEGALCVDLSASSGAMRSTQTAIDSQHAHPFRSWSARRRSSWALPSISCASRIGLAWRPRLLGQGPSPARERAGGEVIVVCSPDVSGSLS